MMFRVMLTAAWIATISSSGLVNASLCPGDTNADAIVNVDDLFAVINSWGQHGVTHSIAVSNYQFEPGALQARVHDQVQWILEFGLHTATSGEACSADGHFNVAISPAAPVFSYVLAPSDVGTLNYFCDPHCGLGMTGAIDVAPFAADLTDDGLVNVDDLLAVINTWGPCP